MLQERALSEAWRPVPSGRRKATTTSAGAATFQNGRVVVAGDVEVSNVGESLPGVARLEVALLFADSFESGWIRLWSGSSLDL